MIRREVCNVGTVYIIRNTKNDKAYIGQTTASLKERFRHHLSSLLCKEKQGMKLYSAMMEIGKENFYIEPLEENVPDDLLIKKEEEYIEKFDSYRNGYNGRAGGKGGKALSYKEEQNILEMAKSGVSGTEIAKSYNVHVATIYRLLARKGFRYIHLNDEDIIKLLSQGMTRKEISEVLCVDKATVERHMRKIGIKERKKYIPHRDDFDFDGLKNDYYSQMKIPDLCEKYDISVTTFYRIKKNKQFKTRPHVYSTGKVRTVD